MSDENLVKAVGAIEEKIGQKFDQYHQELEEHGKATAATREELKAMAADHADMVKGFPEMQERVKQVEQELASGVSLKSGGGKNESWGKQFTGSDSFASFKSGDIAKASVQVKNTIIGEGGSPQDPQNTLVQADRLAGIVPGAFRLLNVLDVVPSGATDSNQIEYTRELAFTNNAAEAAESAAKAQTDLTFELVSDPVRTIAHWIKASKQVLDDASMLESYINRRMAYGVRKRLQTQILKGNGTSPNIVGLDQTGRHTDFTPTSGDTALDSLNRAKYAVIAQDYEPDFIFMNPADWGAIERLKKSNDGYVAGDGAGLTYINGGLQPVVWGVPVIPTNDVASGKFYIGDSNAMQLFMREGVSVQMFEQDDTNVQSNLLTIRAEMRAALAVYLPAAIHYGDLTT